MSFSWGHTLIGTEPEGNPDFWHSALTTLLFTSGESIHFYHQWLTTQSHCSLVPWSCKAKWAFRNSAEPNRWDWRQMPAGRGVQSLPPTAHPIQKTQYFPSVWFLHCQQASTSCCGREATHSCAQQQSRLIPNSSLAGVNHTIHTASEWVDWLGRKMVAKWDWPVTWHICIPQAGADEISLYLKLQYARRWITTPAPLLFQGVVVMAIIPHRSWQKERRRTRPQVNDKTAPTLRAVFFSKLNFSRN